MGVQRGAAAGHAARTDRDAIARIGRAARGAVTAMESGLFHPPTTRTIFRIAASRYWFPGRETMPASERERADSRTAARQSAPMPTSARRSTGANGTRPDSIPRSSESLEDFEAKVPVVQKKDLRAAQERSAAVRRLSVRARSRDFPHPRHQRHHRPAHRVRHRPQRLAGHRQRACANHVGDGLAARRHDLRRVDFLALHGKLGRARRRRAAGGAVFPVRRGRFRHVGALRPVARP